MPSPWLYIISLYFPFGLMSAGLMVSLPNSLFKLLEFSNQQIGMLSGLGLVASLRFLFAPWLDGAATKRGSRSSLSCSREQLHSPWPGSPRSVCRRSSFFGRWLGRFF